MKRIVFVIGGCLIFALSRADESCGAIHYQCNVAEKEMRITFDEKECGLGEEPFKYFDSDHAGLYDSDRIRKPVVKKCSLGGTPLTMVITADCAMSNGTVAAIKIFRDDTLSLDIRGSRIRTASVPIAYAPRFGLMCGQEDQLTMVFRQINVKLVQSTPTQLFAVEMK